MRRITVREQLNNGTDSFTHRVVFWVPTPEGHSGYYANPAFASVLTGPTAPTPEELGALRDGTVKEVVAAITFAKLDGEGQPLSEAAIKSAAATKLGDYYAALVSQIAIENPYLLDGATYDDVDGWTVPTLT